MIQLNIYIHSFSYSFPLWFITGYWIQFPALYSRILLFIHSIYNSLHLLIPNSQLTPPPLPFPLRNHNSGELLYLLLPDITEVSFLQDHLYVNFLVLDFCNDVGKVNLNPKYCPIDIHREVFSTSEPRLGQALFLSRLVNQFFTNLPFYWGWISSKVTAFM